jgi:tetratricopeptide (TPR) repeat protein
MRLISFLLFYILVSSGFSQDYYEKASNQFRINDLDSARFYINQNLRKKPTAKDYFLSAMIHEAEGMDLRAIADYEATIRSDPNNIEAFFQKGLIYYNSASLDQAIKDFSYVIDHHAESSTKAIYYGNDPFGSKGTFLTTLQSMLGRVYQYRGLANQKAGYLPEALADFNTSFKYDTAPDFYINRSLLYSEMNQDRNAVSDLQSALQLEPQNYLAWYNLVILDESTIVPDYLLADEDFTPMLNLLGANAYEQGNFALSAQYHTKAIDADPNDDFGYINRGKALLRAGVYAQARQDFLQAMRLNANRTEAFYLIGNSFFHEKKFEEAVGFYEQYLSIDRGYKNVWYNAAMAYFEEDKKDRACVCLKSAERLGMSEATDQLKKQCDNQ